MNAMKKLLIITALGEGAFGLLLLVYPPIALHALFGVEILDVDGLSVIMSRIAGVAIIGLGVACWPSRTGESRQQFYGMLAYSILVMLYLLRIGVRGVLVGPFLWPAVIVHLVLIVLLVFAGVKARKSGAA
jgi:hypothetical protein